VFGWVGSTRSVCRSTVIDRFGLCLNLTDHRCTSTRTQGNGGRMALSAMAFSCLSTTTTMTTSLADCLCLSHAT
jgi:hypothetical protein